MRKFFALALLGLAGLGLATGRASAWWFHCCHHCTITIKCKQYNAFSPYCCDGACGYVPPQPYPTCPQGGSCYFPGGNGCLGELPSSAQVISDHSAHAATAPTSAAPMTAPPMIAGPAGQPRQPWGPGMTNPAPAPGFWQYMPMSNGGR
jgi:hypothetical protein